MVHDRCLDVLAFALALGAQRVGTKERLRESAPPGAVATGSSGAHLLRVEGSMLVTIFLSLGHQLGAAGMPAGMVREPWHHRHRLSNRKGQSRFPGPDLHFSHLNPIIRGDSQSLSFPLMLSGHREFPSRHPVPSHASGRYAGCCSASPRRSAPKRGSRGIVFPAGSEAPHPPRRGWWP